MRGRIGAGFLIVLLILLLLGCNSDTQADDVQDGRILLWHTWSGTDEEALNELLANFNEVYPQIQVISISYTPDDLRAAFVEAASRGLGPDIIIGAQLWTPELVDANLIHDIDEAQIDAATYLAPALDTLRYRGQLYGLPLAIKTSALYYNKKLTDDTPETLDDLLEQAVEGQKVAINSDFEAAFWGIQAFGGRLLDDDGHIVLNQGGFANWLAWLIEAANIPNIIISKDEQLLNDLFAQGEVSYYVGQSSELLALQESLGKETVGVSPLPSGPNSAAGPFLTSEPIFLSNDSSPAQTERAMLLLAFLGNVEQQRKLAQETGRIPANPQARIDRRISPAVAGFIDQSKTAIPMLLLPQIFGAIEQGQESYLQALQGLVAPGEAAYALTAAVNDAYDLEYVAATDDPVCDAKAIIDIWHAWPEDEARLLQRVGRDFTAHCPQVTFAFTSFDPDDLFARYRQALQEGQGPDLLLISSEFTTRLASAGLVADITDQIEPEFLQRYLPEVPMALRFDGSLYGLPLTMETMALYYNDYLVDEPPVDLGDLLSQIGPDRQFAMPYTPLAAVHWGIPAFGGRLFDVDGNLAITEGHFDEWLSWLQEADDHPGMILTRDRKTARDLFTSGQVAYLVGERELLPYLQEQMGANRVRVAPLPAGPEGSAGPILTVQGLVINPDADDPVAALEFTKFAMDRDSQKLLMSEGNLLPATASVVNANAYPALAGFVAQANTAVVINNHSETDTIFRLGDIIYEQVLNGNGESTAVLQSFNDFFAQIHEPDADETTIACDWDGELTLWHSSEGNALAALEQSIAGFARRCPSVVITAHFVPAMELPRQLAAASRSGSAPDLFLAAHDLVAPLSEDRLIKPVTPWISDVALIPYLPQATAALRYAGELYGLPQTVRTTVLFYNARRAHQPSDQLAELFASTSVSETLALESNFLEAFWGANLFGGELATNGQGTLDLSQTMLVDWLEWLRAHQEREGIVINSSPEQLREMFAVGNAAYLISGSDALPRLRLAMNGANGDAGEIGVAPLPEGRAGSPTPFLTVEGYLFSAEATEEQTQLALEFAQFATSGTSQLQLVETAGLPPANILALTLSDDPALNAIVEQARSSIPLPPRPQNMILSQGGDQLYRQVLEDGEAPADALAGFMNFIDKTPPPLIVPYAGEQVLLCEEQGNLLLWHSWPFAASTNAEGLATDDNALARIIAEFNKLCPEVTVNSEYVPADQLGDRLAASAAAGTTPDLFLARHDLIAPLAESMAIEPITNLVDEAFLARHLPQSLEALRYDGELFGLPQSLDLAALYYNSDIISTTVSTVDELLLAAESGDQVALDSSFQVAHWGVGAFGGTLVNSEGELVDDSSAIVDWLNWLTEAQQLPGIVLDDDLTLLQERFASGEFAYLAASSEALAPLRESMGDQVRVARLPAGSGGSPSPLLAIHAFLFTSGNSPEQTDLALKFAQFAATDANQMLLAKDALLVPSNRMTAETIDDPAIAIMASQAAETGEILPSEHMLALNQAGNNLYVRVLDEAVEPQEALAEFAVIAGGERSP